MSASNQLGSVAQGTVVQLKRTFNQGQLTYVAQVTVESQTLWVQIDTGSSDFWLASDKCGTQSCQGKEGYTVTLFRDDLGLETGEDVQISYLQGTVSGPIVSSNTTFAGTLIPNQAFLTADQVDAEPLGAMQATGVLGLALPITSLIQSQLSTARTGLNNSITDPSRTGSLLPGLWLNVPEGQRFFGLGLQRLPSDGGNGNSTITFGDYDTAYLPTGQQSQVSWQPVLPDDDGVIRHWKTFLSDLQLRVNNTNIDIPLSKTGAVGAATAILDSAAPLNYANPSFLNALYGAYNVGPSADGTGEYYLDCGLQIDMTITVGGVKVPIHPLDTSLKYSNMMGVNSNDGCIGSFQAFSPNVDPTSIGAQIVLGAPFLRSVYSLYSCDPNPRNMTKTGWCSNPWMGIYPLYNTTTQYAAAQADFQKVRLQGQQLGDNSAVDGASSKSSKGFPEGAKIAIGVVCALLALLLIMAGLLLWLKRRRSRHEPEAAEAASGSDAEEKDPVHGSVDWSKLSENERQKARELAMLHGHFVEDPESGRGSPTMGASSPDGDWDISSKGYWEARAIRNDYLRRTREGSSQAAKSLSTAVDSDGQGGYGVEAHEMIASPPSHLRRQDESSPPMTPYQDYPDSPEAR